MRRTEQINLYSLGVILPRVTGPLVLASLARAMSQDMVTDQIGERVELATMSVIITVITFCVSQLNRINQHV